MRKFYIIAILMFALIGCSEPVEAPHHEIGFVSQISRSIVEGVTDLYNEGVKLFGTVSIDDRIVRLFDAEELYYNTTLWDWCYSNTRYWVPQAEHRFCALWPDSTECTFNDQSATVTINHTTSTSGADLLYATSTRNLVGSEDYSAVPLSFSHACAALQFNIINASNAVISQVSDIYLVGLRNSGTFTFGADVAAEWELGSSVVAANDKTTFGGTNLQNLPININLKQPLYSGGAILVLPQEILTDVKFHVTINAENKTIQLGSLGGSAPVKWEAGKKYEYTMTIKENEIVSNVSVIPWVEHYVDL